MAMVSRSVAHCQFVTGFHWISPSLFFVGNLADHEGPGDNQRCTAWPGSLDPEPGERHKIGLFPGADGSDCSERKAYIACQFSTFPGRQSSQGVA